MIIYPLRVFCFYCNFYIYIFTVFCASARHHAPVRSGKMHVQYIGHILSHWDRLDGVRLQGQPRVETRSVESDT